MGRWCCRGQSPLRHLVVISICRWQNTQILHLLVPVSDSGEGWGGAGLKLGVHAGVPCWEHLSSEADGEPADLSLGTKVTCDSPSIDHALPPRFLCWALMVAATCCTIPQGFLRGLLAVVAEPTYHPSAFLIHVLLEPRVTRVSVPVCCGLGPSAHPSPPFPVLEHSASSLMADTRRLVRGVLGMMGSASVVGMTAPFPARLSSSALLASGSEYWLPGGTSGCKMESMARNWGRCISWRGHARLIWF